MRGRKVIGCGFAYDVRRVIGSDRDIPGCLVERSSQPRCIDRALAIRGEFQDERIAARKRNDRILVVAPCLTWCRFECARSSLELWVCNTGDIKIPGRIDSYCGRTSIYAGCPDSVSGCVKTLHKSGAAWRRRVFAGDRNIATCIYRDSGESPVNETGLPDLRIVRSHLRNETTVTERRSLIRDRLQDVEFRPHN